MAKTCIQVYMYAYIINKDKYTDGDLFYSIQNVNQSQILFTNGNDV